MSVSPALLKSRNAEHSAAATTRVFPVAIFFYGKGLTVATRNTNLAIVVTEVMVEAAGVEPASENVTGQETTCLFAFMPQALPWDVRDPRSERTRNGCR